MVVCDTLPMRPAFPEKVSQLTRSRPGGRPSACPVQEPPPWRLASAPWERDREVAYFSPPFPCLVPGPGLSDQPCSVPPAVSPVPPLSAVARAGLLCEAQSHGEQRCDNEECEECECFTVTKSYATGLQ